MSLTDQANACFKIKILQTWKIDIPFTMVHLHWRLWSYLRLHLYVQTSLKYL